MRTASVWAVALVMSLSLAAAASAEVREICAERFFDEVVGYDRPVLVEFYRPGCPVCTRMGPIFDELSGELSGRVKTVRINTQDERELSARFEIKNVPTFVYFDNGNVMKRHIGGNSREGLMALAGLSAPRAEAPEVCEESFFDEVVGYGKPVVVEFFSPTCPVCKKMAPTVEELRADLAGRVKFVKVNTRDNSRLSMQFDIKNVPTFVYFDGGNVMVRHVGGSSKDGLKLKLGIK